MEGCIELKRVELTASSELGCQAAHWLFVGLRTGAAYAIATGGHRAVNGGDLLVLPPGASMVLRASQLGSCVMVSCDINPDSLLGLLTVHERDRLRGLKSPETGLAYYAADTAFASQFLALSNRAAGLRMQDRVAWISFAAEYWAAVLPDEGTALESADASDRFRQLVARISVAELSKLSAGELAQECGCSVRHFSRLFHERFGKSLRDFQIEERLRYASQLLRDSHNKVIDVAMESGFGHLSHFNALFKSQFGVTPSAWRRRCETGAAPRGRRSGLAALAALGLYFFMSPDSHAAAVTNAPAGGGTNAPAKVSPRFAIARYEVEGNTVLTTNIIDKVLGDHVGPECTYDTLRDAIKELQLTYRGRGFVTVSVTLPVQSITNGLVRLKVVEGKLANIRVTGNRWFSSNNVMSSLPSLKTNLIINSAWFQTELDQANGNRDRQIYPIVGPGPEPGTTDLQLKVKDRLPLHGRWELNNKGSPGTPDLRMDASVQYANLWQLEHQVGIQYNFTPGTMKPGPATLYDEPLISSYSGFYRLPLFPRSALLDNEAFTSSDFGYDPITRKFKAPPASGRPEMIFFASRSSTDSGVLQDPTKFVLGDLANLNDRFFITQGSWRQNISVNEGVGLRVQGPLPKMGIFQHSFSFGPDWKHYYQKSLATNQYASFFEQAAVLTSPADRRLTDPAYSDPQALDLPESVNDYLLMSGSWTVSETDKWGSSSFSFTPSVSVQDFRGTQSIQQHRIGGTNIVSDVSQGRFFTLNGAYSRDQVIFEEWLLSLRANGQWANQELISAEQFGLGGTTGVRGYRDGEEYGDSGWRVLVEPKTPSIELGNWQGESIIRGRFSLFTDYGERYLQNPQGRVPSVAEWGAGFGVIITVTEKFDARAAVAWPLLDTPGVKAGSGRVHFSISAQF